jgi:hypothetical protein
MSKSQELKGAPIAPLGYRIDEFVRVSGIGRSSTYGYMRSGRLKAVKAGCRTIITAESAHELLRSLPLAYPASGQGGA